MKRDGVISPNGMKGVIVTQPASEMNIEHTLYLQLACCMQTKQSELGSVRKAAVYDMKYQNTTQSD